MIAGLLKELLLQKPENLEILTLTPAIMEVETYRMLKLTHLGGETIFHFHDYYGRKSGLCQDFLKPVAIFEQIDGSHLHDFKYATLDASELPIS